MTLLTIPYVVSAVCMGPFKCYVTQMGVGCVKLSGKKRYEGVRFNVSSVTKGVGGGSIPEKKRYT